MAKTTIEVSVDISSAGLYQKLVHIAEGEVMQYLRKKSDAFLERLTTEVGARAARGAYGGTPINVWCEKIPRGWKVVADGEAVGFIEFGAGTMADKSHPFAQNAPFEVKPGSWSLTYGSGQFIPGRHESWTFGGRVYRFVQPRRGLYQAYQQMYKDMRQIAIEVFNE